MQRDEPPCALAFRWASLRLRLGFACSLLGRHPLCCLCCACFSRFDRWGTWAVLLQAWPLRRCRIFDAGDARIADLRAEDGLQVIGRTRVAEGRVVGQLWGLSHPAFLTGRSGGGEREYRNLRRGGRAFDYSALILSWWRLRRAQLSTLNFQLILGVRHSRNGTPLARSSGTKGTMSQRAYPAQTPSTNPKDLNGWRTSTNGTSAAAIMPAYIKRSVLQA
jgi:hypothetical protein